ncbi:MAG: hypothetical protein LBQ23_01505 [Puniceicoccales bacterium]|nr:hypothetical protein [Puniceicoccales bacterium]
MMQQTHAPVNAVASMFGVCSNTIRSVASWAVDLHPFGKPGVPKLLKPHHILYVEARTIYDRKMTNEELAREMIAFYPDLPRCSAKTIDRYRNSLGLHYLPMRQGCHMSDAARHKRILWCQKQQELDTDWRKIFFNDESWFELSTARRNHWVWRHHYDYRSRPETTEQLKVCLQEV